MDAGRHVCLDTNVTRTGLFGPWDYWRLSFTEIEWVHDGAFNVAKPSVLVAGGKN